MNTKNFQDITHWSIFVLFTWMITFSSCDLFNFASCAVSPDCSAPFEFTLGFSTSLSSENVTIGDTFLLRHELPYWVTEDKNFQEYDLQNIPYDPILSIGELIYQNNYVRVQADHFDFVSVENSGTLWVDTLPDNKLRFQIAFEELIDKYFLEVEVIAKKEGEFLLSFYYLEDDLSSKSFTTLDTCCFNQTIQINYNCSSDNTELSDHITDSLWIDEGVREYNIFALDERYDFFYFRVIE